MVFSPSVNQSLLMVLCNRRADMKSIHLRYRMENSCPLPVHTSRGDSAGICIVQSGPHKGPGTVSAGHSCYRWKAARGTWCGTVEIDTEKDTYPHHQEYTSNDEGGMLITDIRRVYSIAQGAKAAEHQ